MLRLLAIAGLAMSAMGVPDAHAQKATFYTAAYVEVGPILSRVGASALRTYRSAGQKEKGNVHLEVMQSLDRSNQFVVLGAWVDRAAYEAHAGSAHARALHEKLEDLLVAPVDTRQHGSLSSPQTIAPDKSAVDAVVAVTHVDVVPPQKDRAVAALKELADESRQHPGNLQFHVWQQTDRPNHFTVVEAWYARGAFNVHQMRKETRDFRARLAPLLGALYDERLFKNLK